MTLKAIILASAVLAATPAPAFAENVYYVRNDTGIPYTCGLRRDPNRKIYRFVLLSGQEHSRALAGGSERTLLCDSSPVTQRFRMRSGVRYSLIRQPEGDVVLRPIGPTP